MILAHRYLAQNMGFNSHEDRNTYRMQEAISLCTSLLAIREIVRRDSERSEEQFKERYAGILNETDWFELEEEQTNFAKPCPLSILSEMISIQNDLVNKMEKAVRNVVSRYKRISGWRQLLGSEAVTKEMKSMVSKYQEHFTTTTTSRSNCLTSVLIVNEISAVLSRMERFSVVQRSNEIDSDLIDDISFQIIRYRELLRQFDSVCQ